MVIGIDGNEANVKKPVGSNIYALRLLEQLYRSDQKNQYIIYLKSPPDYLPKEKVNWKYKVLKPGKLWTRWRLPLELYLSTPKPDLFFTPGHYAPKFCPVPKAISIMDLSFLHFPEMFKVKDLYTLKNWTRESINKANHIFTISNFSKEEIIKNYSIEESKITVTYPGINFERLRKVNRIDLKKLKRKFRIKDDYIIYIGTLQPRKNLPRLFKAFQILKDESLSLVISGKKGWHYDKIFKEVDKLGLKEKIVFTGYLNEEEKVSLLENAKCLVLVSLYEGFGIPILEAMGLGTPVVVSDTSSLPEIAGDQAIKVNPLDDKSIKEGLQEALQIDEVTRKDISDKFIKLAGKFTWQNCANKTLEVLNEIAI